MAEFLVLGEKDVKVGQKAVNMALVVMAEYLGEDPRSVKLIFLDGHTQILSGLEADQVVAWIQTHATQPAVLPCFR